MRVWPEGGDLQWLETVVWDLIRREGPISERQIICLLVPPSNSLLDRTIRKKHPVWCTKSNSERVDMARDVIRKLAEIGRVEPQSNERYSKFTLLTEVPVLEYLAQIRGGDA